MLAICHSELWIMGKSRNNCGWFSALAEANLKSKSQRSWKPVLCLFQDEGNPCFVTWYGASPAGAPEKKPIGSCDLGTILMLVLDTDTDTDSNFALRCLRHGAFLLHLHMHLLVHQFC